MEPDVCIRRFSFIFEMDAESMIAPLSVLHTNLIPIMPAKIVPVELIVLVMYNIHTAAIAGPRTIRS